ncbi:hypothetical protein SFBM_1245 [Candidatus Arthromitus sp. SFB-mouse-Japan]|uniref:hypothetical protein n=1 Tax=unclassified Candidatus Neoarthromitus TaxID=2638829 RepID=UPI00021B8206|nr:MULTISPECIES: hypothetical protein [unclassified Candidatus Arthromitus]EIA23382.1 Putative regulator [Candidatus Arthromitus sp. SFB-1]EIA27257.1 hypothetical protein SFB6_113G9 [Candidatus Arthromitus sp. SFB-co]EIA30022.1 hypothetical protein SFBSU_007G161 [Candidatus Arthromitus sp. SFB-mouse-SU]AID45216.1 Hypothetical protein SFBmNL_01312 [Candidatus Arthromitus sp. SFB-mouse-NL]EGX28314.1 hypothetical protein SFBNYU_003300 [Candidatus Arthromitus sp. SFB-mouse-NYU]
MNYKLRNLIGIVAFICILLVTINLDFILKTVDIKILGKEFVGIKDGKIFLSSIDTNKLTKDDLVKYIMYNLQEINLKNLDEYKFSIHSKDINTEDSYIERFNINIDENFESSLYKSLDLLDKNKDLYLKIFLKNNEKIYMSDIFVVNIDDGLYQSYENVITLNDYTIKGITSLVNIPENINISSNSKFTITANFNENKISGLSIDYDKNNKKIIIGNLVPGKQYLNVEIIADENSSNKMKFIIPKLLMEHDSEIQSYFVKIYYQVLKRYPTEKEYSENLHNILDNTVDLKSILVDIILSDEFDRMNTTPKEMVDSIYFLSNKKVINGRLSIITLEEFNTKLSSAEFINEAKLEILDKFLNMESSKEYMESILNF